MSAYRTNYCDDNNFGKNRKKQNECNCSCKIGSIVVHKKPIIVNEDGMPIGQQQTSYLLAILACTSFLIKPRDFDQTCDICKRSGIVIMYWCQ